MSQLPRQGRKTLASEARNLITIQRLERVEDGEGGHTEIWVNRLPSVWASISPIRADQRAEYKTQNVHATHLVRVRGCVDVVDTGENRILWGDRVFHIRTAEDLQERGVVKVLTCEEIRTRGENY